MQLTRYAYEKGKRPSEVWAEYLKYPRDYALLFAYERFVVQETDKAAEEQRRKQKNRDL